MTIYSLKYSFPDLELVRYSTCSSNYCFLTCIQTSQEAGKVIWYSHLFKNFPQFVVIHTVNGFSVFNEANFFEIILLFLWSGGWMLVIWSLVHLPFLYLACTSGNSQLIYCWRLAWRILGMALLAWEMGAVVHYILWHLNILCHYPSLGMKWKLTFSSPVATAEFSKFVSLLNAALSQHHLLGFEIAQLEFHHLH